MRIKTAAWLLALAGTVAAAQDKPQVKIPQAGVPQKTLHEICWKHRQRQVFLRRPIRPDSIPEPVAWDESNACGDGVAR